MASFQISYLLHGLETEQVQKRSPLSPMVSRSIRCKTEQVLRFCDQAGFSFRGACTSCRFSHWISSELH